jgi:hypothetical protein
MMNELAKRVRGVISSVTSTAIIPCRHFPYPPDSKPFWAWEPREKWATIALIVLIGLALPITAFILGGDLI